MLLIKKGQNLFKLNVIPIRQKIHLIYVNVESITYCDCLGQGSNPDCMSESPSR